MPLISSPIDGSPMREVERYGVKMDICPSSGGIWLDRGELEKIITMIRQEALEENGGPIADGYDAIEQRQMRQAEYEKRPRRKKRDSLFENLLDIFD